MAAHRKNAARRPSVRVEGEFNPNSFNAQFAGLHANLKLRFEAVRKVLDSQDKSLDEIKKQTTATNGRVNRLETSRKVHLAWCAGATAAMTVAAQVLIFFLHK